MEALVRFVKENAEILEPTVGLTGFPFPYAKKRQN